MGSQSSPNNAVNAADDVMGMTVLDHMREAARLMEGPDVDMDSFDVLRADNVATAQAHLAFAQVLLSIQPGMQRVAAEWLRRSGQRYADEVNDDE